MNKGMLCFVLLLLISLPSTVSDIGVERKLPAARKNVLYITLDDYSEIPGTDATPNIDALKGEGVEFTNAYSNFPQCGPSRYSFLSGRYPFKSGFLSAEYVPLHDVNDLNSDANIYAQAKFLPAVMKDAGYLVGMAGKVFHTQNVPDTQYTAFDETFGSSGGIPYKLSGCSFCKCSGSSCTDFSTKETAIQWINDWKDSVQPWIIFAGFVRPHTDIEYDPSLPDVNRFNSYIFSANASTNLNLHTRIRWSENPWVNNIQTTMRLFLKMLVLVDTHIGEILQAVKDTNQDDETMIILHSDHGMHYTNGFSHFAKWTLLEDSLHVPLVVKTPPSYNIPFQAGEKVDAIVELVDVVPTILEYAGIQLDQESTKLLDGESLFKNSREKDFSVSLFPSCDAVSNTRVRTRPCVTIARGADEINAVGYSIKTKDERVIEWRKIKGNARTCSRYDTYDACTEDPTCVPVTRLGPSQSRPYCTVRIDPDVESGVDFTDNSNVIAAEYFLNEDLRTNIYPVGYKPRISSAGITSLFLDVFLKVIGTKSPTRVPTTSPTTAYPTTANPTTSYPTTRSPTTNPTNSITGKPATGRPTKGPTSYPSQRPTTVYPSRNPTKFPTTRPSTGRPTKASPTSRPTRKPTAFPTHRPSTLRPSKSPITQRPTKSPTKYPTRRPTTERPTRNPSNFPTLHPPTKSPTNSPIVASEAPTSSPSVSPTSSPSSSPTSSPSASPTSSPSTSPTSSPSTSPSNSLSISPSSSPSISPTSSTI